LREAGLTLAIVSGALLAGCGAAGKGLDLPKGYVAVTADGWALSLLRYAPANPDPSLPPVVLCHGLSYNGQFWDLARQVSLARWLRDAGYDVWVPSLRGAGWSTKPPISRLRQLFLRGDLYTAGGVFTSAGRGALKINWTVDDHVRGDVPAILEKVTGETAARQVHWVGHSMGGMILIAHLTAHPDEARLRSFVALGAPVFVIGPLSRPLKQLAETRGAVEVGNVLLSTNLPALLGLIGGKALAGPTEALFYNRDNVTDDVIRRLNAWGTEDISPGQLGQLIDMVAGGLFRSIDKKVDYTAGLERLRTPALFCAGTVDNLATVGAVKRLYARWGGKPKRFEMFGVVNGQRGDYGHDDLVIGRRAREEVYPALRRWLDARSGRSKRLTIPLPLAGKRVK